MERQERRDSPRNRIDCAMSFRLAGKDVSHEAFCINISGSGVLFEADDPLTTGTAVEIHLVPQRGVAAPLTAFVEVVRCVATDAGPYRIAGAIKGIKS
ncbi:PilZ domain-containing protein [Methylolobus aquaticus]